MTDTHFYIAFVILSLILAFIWTSNCESFEQSPTSVLDVAMQRGQKLREQVAYVTKQVYKDIYPKVVDFTKRVVTCVNESAIKSKLTEKFLSLS